MVGGDARENTPKIGDLIDRQETFIGDNHGAIDGNADVHDSTFWRDEPGLL